MGDDRTDEDLFERLPESAWSVHVGNGPSKAGYSVPDTHQVTALLRQLTEEQ